MKTLKLFLVFLISIILINSVLAAEITLNVGESKEISGNTIKLKSLKADKVVITVNDESKIINQGEEETIGPLKVKLVEIFYIGPSEGNSKLEVNSLYTCGDNSCEGTESRENCCQDCGCLTGYDCDDNECKLHVEHQCNNDADCDDSNPNTSDRCAGYPRKCKNADNAICNEDIDCDDNKECTNDVCRNNDCFNERIEDCESEEPEIAEESNDDNEQESNDDIDAEEKDNEESQEKSSFFRKILNFFKNLFGSG